VTESVPIETRSRGRTVLAAVVVLAVAAGGAVAWRFYGRPSPAPIVAADSLHTTPSAPQTTLEPLRSQNGELPPLEPTLVTSASARPVGIPAAMSPGKTGAIAPAAATASTAAATAVAPPPTATPPASTAATPPVPATVVPTAVTAAPPAAPPFDPSHAHVDWSVAGSGGGATPGAVQRAMSRAAGSWTQCYRSALVRQNQRIEGTGVLHLTTDESGNVVGAQVRGFDAMPGVKSCIAGSARVRIDGVDTGDSWADIQLSFRPE